MSDEERLAEPGELIADLPSGSVLIVRHRDRTARRRMLASLGRAARKRALLLSVANDWRLASGRHTQGLHLSEAMLRHGPGTWRRARKRPGLVITAAAHGPRAIAAARRAGVDAVLLAPVLPTASHPRARHHGILGLARMARMAGVAVFALGGVGLEHSRRLARSGAVGIAGIGLFQRTPGRDLERVRAAFPKRRKSCINSIFVGNDRAAHLGKK